MATGDITSLTISTSGRTLTFTVEGLTAAGVTEIEAGKSITVACTSLAYSSAGAATTSARTAIPCYFKSSTNNGGNANVVLDLGETIHAEDTVVTASIPAGSFDDGASHLSHAITAGAVTNNSTLAYPKILCRWATVPFQVYNAGDSILLEAAVFAKRYPSAANSAAADFGVAAVAFTVTDGVTPQTQTITAASLSTAVAAASPAYGHTPADQVYLFRAVFDPADFADGALTLSVVAYPKIGDANAVRNSATDTYLSNLAALNNNGGARTIQTAYLDGGHNLPVDDSSGFVVGEGLTASGGAVGTIEEIVDGQTLRIVVVSGTFGSAETVTGGTSSETATTTGSAVARGNNATAALDDPTHPYATYIEAMRALPNAGGGHHIKVKSGVNQILKGAFSGTTLFEPDYWCTIEAWDGDWQDTIITRGGGGPHNITKLCLRNLGFTGAANTAVSASSTMNACVSWMWIDECMQTGAGNTIDSPVYSGMWDTVFFTDTGLQTCLQPFRSGGVDFLVRDSWSDDSVNDSLKSRPCAINTTISGLDPGATGTHTDVWQVDDAVDEPSNAILYHLDCPDSDYQGIFLGSTNTNLKEGCALVNCRIKLTSTSVSSMSSHGRKKLVELVWHCSYLVAAGGAHNVYFRDDTESPNSQIVGCVFDTCQVYDTATLNGFAHNHFVGGLYTYGADASTGSAGLDANDAPAVGSVLIDRLVPCVLADLNGDLRNLSATAVGAYRGPAETPNTAPTATITSAATQTATEGDAVTLTGTGTDTEDGALTGASLVWLDGETEIGTGISLEISNLSIGVHTITLRVTDSGGLTDTDTCTVTIEENDAPVVTISTSSQSFELSTSNNISATATDAEQGSLTSSIVWTSNIQAGTLALGGTLNSNVLNVGVHTLTATVTDTQGLTDTDTVQITITEVNTFNFMGRDVHLQKAVTVDNQQGATVSFPDPYGLTITSNQVTNTIATKIDTEVTSIVETPTGATIRRSTASGFDASVSSMSDTSTGANVISTQTEEVVQKGAVVRGVVRDVKTKTGAIVDNR